MLVQQPKPEPALITQTIRLVTAHFTTVRVQNPLVTSTDHGSGIDHRSDLQGTYVGYPAMRLVDQ